MKKKVIKKSNKRRNMKIATMIGGFLLSCTAAMGTDEQLWIKDNNGKIEFSTNKGGEWISKNPYEENSWDESTNTYINNETLSGENNNGVIKVEASGINLINNGNILGIGYNPGITVAKSKGIDELVNNGNISNYGMEKPYPFAHGILITMQESIRNLINNGNVYAVCPGSSNGFGIYINGTQGREGIDSLINNGNIMGVTPCNGEGIYLDDGLITNLVNNGNIKGKDNGMNSDGIRIRGTSEIADLMNSGTIYGTRSGIQIFECEGGIGKLVNTGTISGNVGIENMQKNVSSRGLTFKNAGIISGDDETINTDLDLNNDSYNYGLLVSGTGSLNRIVTTSNKFNNYGLIIDNAASGVTIAKGTGGKKTITTGYDEIRGEELKRKLDIKNEDGNNSFSGNETDVVLNALENTYKATGTGNEIAGSIINGYGTAVKFDAGGELTLSGTVVNGGTDGKSNAISGDGGAANLILQSKKVTYTDGSSGTENTIINGNINMGSGADILTIGDGTIINGTLDGGDNISKDTLNLGIKSKTKSVSNQKQGINILYDISNFENINVDTNVTLYEKTVAASGDVKDLEVTGAENIIIKKDGVLTVRIDTSDKDSTGKKIVGHALKNNKGTISSVDGGKLLLALNGAGNKSIISFGDNKLDNTLVTGNEGASEKDVTFGTTSKLHSVKRLGGNDVEITAQKNLPVPTPTPTPHPDNITYEKLNNIYHSILSVNELGNFNVDNDKKLSSFMGYLNDIYAGNPYSYSSELSRKSVGMFRDIATENQFKPELNKWLIMGGLTHVDGGTKDTYYGKGYYTYDIGSSDMDADTKITGAYMLGEYGVSDTLAYGVIIGGNKLKSDLSNGSKVDGDALYMGAYAKKYIGNLKITGGLGLQYGDYDADRIAINKVASSLAEPVMKYCDNYNDMTYDIYLNGRYSHNIGNNLFLEPYGTLSYTYIKQDGADEGNKTLAIETDSKSFDYTAAKIGVDLKKVIPHEKGKSTLSAGVSCTKLLNGAEEENITGRFKGGSDFDILVAHKNEHNIELNAKYALELEDGVLFDVKGSYSVERDSHNGTRKNKAEGEWIVGVGLGYKF